MIINLQKESKKTSRRKCHKLYAEAVSSLNKFCWKSTQLNKQKGFKSHLTCQIDYEATYFELNSISIGWVHEPFIASVYCFKGKWFWLIDFRDETSAGFSLNEKLLNEDNAMGFLKWAAQILQQLWIETFFALIITIFWGESFLRRKWKVSTVSPCKNKH